MHRTASAILSAALAASIATTASAQIKAHIQPKPWSVIEAERAAKAEREAAKQMAKAAERGHEDAFARADSDKNGRLSLDEFKQARLEDQREPSPPDAPQAAR